MRVLIVGGGGREHALAWKCAQSERVTEVLVAPGNAGTAGEPGVTNVDVAAEDIPALLKLAQSRDVGLTIVGPEVPLVDGIVDQFEEAGLRCFGPKASAARLEGSKAFTKDFLQRHEIPTAEYQAFTDFALAKTYIETRGAPIVVKADGLAAGKGVVVATTVDEAIEAARSMLVDGDFANAGAQIVVEDFLAGEEASFICIVDGTTVVPLATSQDHKARDNGDTGPNTGGMGAYSPAPVVTDSVHERIMNEIIVPTVAGLAKDDDPYTGFLYAGVMIDEENNPRVLEYNCRFGDPETQPVLMRLKSDLVELCEAAIDHKLGDMRVEWDSRRALGVVMAAGGYPGSYRKGDVIAGLDGVAQDAKSAAQSRSPQSAEPGRQDDELDTPEVKVFHAGTTLDGDSVCTSGGRVLCVTALGDTVEKASASAYKAVSAINWQDCFCRTDIGYRAIAREQQAPQKKG